MEQKITDTEKIDYIYNRLKKQERSEKLRLAGRWLFRIIIILYLIYLYKVALPGIKDDILESITPSINLEESETFQNVKQYIDNTF